ncbi:MAG: hypothetical protein J4F97_02140 [Pseudomonadales bacterium]|nr:hypothetical protein [Pseudomonadales bacterium]
MTDRNETASEVEGPSAFANIAPTHPDLSRDKRVGPRYRRSRPGLRVSLQVSALGALLVATVVILVNVRGDRLGETGASGSSEVHVPPAEPAAAERVEPFRDIQLERARDEAREVLKEFSGLQTSMQRTYNGGSFDIERLQGILATASDGDVLFAERDFEEALTNYKQATASLRSFLADADQTVESQLLLADRHLNARNEESARNAIDTIEAIRPGLTASEEYMKRLAALPELRRLIREAGRAELREDYGLALSYLVDARSLDPATNGISERITQMWEKIEDRRIRERLSVAYTHLRNRRFDEAERAFETFLQAFPDNKSALSGLQETRQNRTAEELQRLRDEAEAAERSDQPVNALVHYRKALQIDATLQFAKHGLERLSTVGDAIAIADRILEDPHVLSSESELEAARNALTELEVHSKFSAGSRSRAESLGKLIIYHMREFPLVLISDNSTEVILPSVQALGSFARFEATLRPGRYTVIGSRDGYHDVRKEIIVGPNMPPVVIQCDKPI